mgnify:FL=1
MSPDVFPGRVPELAKPEPPSEWYVAIGRRGRGISIVNYSDALLTMNNGEVGKQIGNWNHNQGTLMWQNPSERDPEIVAIVEKAAEYLKRAIGFAPEELAGKKLRLLNDLGGKDEASIQVILVD